MSDESLFVNDVAAARCVVLALHRFPLKEFTSPRKKPEGPGGLFPPKNTTTASQAEDLLWRWASFKNFTLQELKELREDRLLSYGLDQRDHRIEFAHLIAKRQLHSVMEGLSQQSKPSAHDERASSRQPGAGLSAPMSAAALRRFHLHGSGVLRSDQVGQEKPPHALCMRLLLSLILLDPQLRIGTLWDPFRATKFVDFENTCTRSILPLGWDLVVSLAPMLAGQSP
ncbi:ATP-binding cassette (ABC) Superfamily [Phytophthora palmivora]|uniref:ATP-binding cassette (ABC) Superfamily n=1 Tax=Phytophthora palmivora TaxID=4796 RepID=A0A2P4WY43_9STRA|nr:ATP-binding cassette (ABC) Superfamily [Phytophthora palmivora]